MPALALTSAIPEPISPPPTIPTLSIDKPDSSNDVVA